MSKQHTILNPVSLKGVGIHTGKEVNLTLNLQKKTLVMFFVELTYLTTLQSKLILIS